MQDFVHQQYHRLSLKHLLLNLTGKAFIRAFRDLTCSRKELPFLGFLIMVSIYSSFLGFLIMVSIYSSFLGFLIMVSIYSSFLGFLIMVSIYIVPF